MYDYGFRMYDPRIGRFFTVDPLKDYYPELTPFPDDWIEKPSKKGGGKRYIDPNNNYNNVRVMPGDPASPYSNSQKPYVKWQKNGQHLDKNGNRVSGDSPDAHIPLEDFKYK